ncbi:deoxyribose-phosphate aldolase [Piscinibacter terrae]|uniref:Deoxyribose-phosphate aldolase n=1 Tax=Piscinibacter terrae TaxID=2496871 RepID=A0A3N7HHJ3_9BURK|nr:deoxyribose-phosphate aldolase [Albitalea terrae]RQP21517.1 deoxyribose-phosphate aldolase [Albitalea terrae]
MTDLDAARLALRCLDLTSLKDDDSEASITALARRANTPHGAPAALCVYPQFVSAALRALAEQGLGDVKVATVVNFPRGESSADEVVQQTRDALASGAHEIDLVFPWRALLAADRQAGRDLVARCKQACGDATLKVILETGELRASWHIRDASDIALAAGADFLKTSTGKVPVNATPEAAAVMLDVIHQHGGRAGLKIAGGLSTLADVKQYLALAARTYGEQGLSPGTLRFGASSLLPVLLAAIEGRSPAAAQGPY